MNFQMEKFAAHGINSRSFTEEDFYRICDEENIKVIEIGEPFSWWMNLDGESYIVLNKKLRGYKLLFTMFHELAHAILHAGRGPDAIECFNANNSKQEAEADLIATLLIYSPDDLRSGELLPFEEFDKYLRKIRRDRERLNFYHKI